MQARRRFAFLVVFILLTAPIAIGTIYGNFSGTSTHVLASSPNYTENLALYLTSSDTLWHADYVGGNISISSLSIPSSVSAFSITLTHYTNWQTQFELFTRYGFGILGNNEPSPNGAFLEINATSQADAQALANSLSQRFALVFEPVSQNNGVYTFFSPLDFLTEMHVYFWKLIPSYYGGFATLMSEQQYEANSLLYYHIAYSSSRYAITVGAIAPLSSTQFTLYGQLGLSAPSYNYSSSASNSTIEVRVLGGIIVNSSSHYTNDFSNFSALMTTSSKSSNGTIPNLGATLNLSFPTIIAYRQVSPSLTPSQNSNESVTIFIKNVSPTNAPLASNVAVNDSWIYSHPSDFNLTVRTTGGKTNLTSGQSINFAYAFRVLAKNGTFNLPATPVTYQFLSGNKTVTAQALLNPETLVVGGQNSPQLEATEALTSGTIQAGQSFSVNVTVTNKGSGTAFNLNASGLTKQNLPSGSSWSFITNATSASLTQTNSSVSYLVSWTDSSGASHSANTNTMSTVFSFASPGTPGVGIRKAVNVSNSTRSANVTLTIYDNSANAVSNITINDSLPSGILFAKSFNSSSLRLANASEIVGNVSSIKAHSNITLIYSVNITKPHENYVFMPATASSKWDNSRIVHPSAGFGLALGVLATKTVTPSQAFQGSNVTVSIGLVNSGSLPIYQVSLNNTFDPFINVASSSSAFKAVLNPGGVMNATLKANLTGAQGSYNSSNAAARFIFAGANSSALSVPYSVTIYPVVQANLTSSALKYEEQHNINITIMVHNPSNVTVNSVAYTMKVPAGLNVLYGGQTNFTIPALGPGRTQYHSIIVLTNQPTDYEINSTNANLVFQYQGHVLKGSVNGLNLNLQDDKIIRYVIPIAIAVVLALAALFYVRRLQKHA